MTGYERIASALEGRPTDSVPIMLHNFLMAAREAGYSQSVFRSNPQAAADSFIQSVEKYRFDGVVMDIDTATLAGAIGVPLDLPDDKPARVSGSLLTDIEQARELEPVSLEDDERVRVWLDVVRILKQHFGGEIFIRGNCDQAPFSLAAMVRSMTDWMLDLTDSSQEENVHALLDYCTGVVTSMIELMVEAGADMVSNGDSLAGPAMVSPQMYRRFALPYERRCVDAAREAGRPYGLHICGDTTRILEDMQSTGTDAVELDYLTDTEKARDAFFDSTCFIGNLDPSGVLAMGSTELVRASTSTLLETFRGCHRFILNAGCAIPAETPGRNLRVMIDTARSFA